MVYDMYVFTNRSVYLILKLIVKRGLIITQRILIHPYDAIFIS